MNAISRRLRRTAMIALLAAALSPAEGRADPAPRIEVVGTAFQVTEADGRVLSGAALAGSVITIRGGAGARLEIRIASVRPDDKDADGDVLLHELQGRDPDSGAWTNLCQPGPDGLALGFPLAGTMAADGRYLPTPGSFTVACTSGVLAKCVRMGYKPWKTTADGVPMLDAYRACTRMLRADYCGDGTAHTREGTPIDVYDTLGIQTPEPGSTLGFEAVWDAAGAVCVRKARIPERFPLDELIRECPERLRGRVGDDCSADDARAAPGRLLLLNNS